MSTVIVQVNGAIGAIILNRPKVNALSAELMEAITSALHSMQEQNLRVVILRAKPGVKIFSAGHEVSELPTNGRDPLTYNDPLRQLVRAIQLHPCPIIAMIEGSVWGGACEMVMSCDLIVAGQDTTLAITPAKLGVPYNLSGIINFMRVADIPFIKEMLFTAQPVAASRLLQCGVINHVVPREELESFTQQLAAQIVENSPLVLRTLKEAFRVLTSAHPITPEAYERIQSLRHEVFDSEDYQEGIQAFRQKRKPNFQGR
jgi:methylmalonyl-CoA decarboxylase